MNVTFDIEHLTDAELKVELDNAWDMFDDNTITYQGIGYSCGAWLDLLCEEWYDRLTMREKEQWDYTMERGILQLGESGNLSIIYDETTDD